MSWENCCRCSEELLALLRKLVAIVLLNAQQKILPFTISINENITNKWHVQTLKKTSKIGLCKTNGIFWNTIKAMSVSVSQFFFQMILGFIPLDLLVIHKIRGDRLRFFLSKNHCLYSSPFNDKIL